MPPIATTIALPWFMSHKKNWQNIQSPSLVPRSCMEWDLGTRWSKPWLFLASSPGPTQILSCSHDKIWVGPGDEARLSHFDHYCLCYSIVRGTISVPVNPSVSWGVGLVSQGRPNQPQCESLSVSHTLKTIHTGWGWLARLGLYRVFEVCKISFCWFLFCFQHTVHKVAVSLLSSWSH